jgi:hypothetical protein
MRRERIAGHAWGPYVALETCLRDGPWEGLQDARLLVPECS